MQQPFQQLRQKCRVTHDMRYSLGGGAPCWGVLLCSQHVVLAVVGHAGRRRGMSLMDLEFFLSFFFLGGRHIRDRFFVRFQTAAACAFLRRSPSSPCCARAPPCPHATRADTRQRRR